VRSHEQILGVGMETDGYVLPLCVSAEPSTCSGEAGGSLLMESFFELNRMQFWSNACMKMTEKAAVCGWSEIDWLSGGPNFWLGGRVMQ
jgi:hypothetical protein